MHCKTLRGKIKDQEEDKKDFQILKEDLEAKLKEQGWLMMELQTSYINTVGELDSWKTRALEWKEKVKKMLLNNTTSCERK